MLASNQRPRDSDLRSFRYSLDYAFTVAELALGGRRLVSTPSSVRLALKLGSALAYASQHLAFAEFDDIHARSFLTWCTTRCYESPALPLS